MKRVFADTSYFVALLNPGDEYHDAAVELTETFDGQIVTTSWVLVELGNFLAGSPNRALLASLVRTLRASARTRIVGATERSFHEGLDLYARRPDKRWSLTDCMSFTTMRRGRLTAALTTDQHFAQAGFEALLRRRA